MLQYIINGQKIQTDINNNCHIAIDVVKFFWSIEGRS
jgi:hypothetical protein